MKQNKAFAAELAPTGHLRAVLNLANTVLAHSHTASTRPAGVTVDLSIELARRLDVPVKLLAADTPGEALRHLADGTADIGYLAVDPQRAREVMFTSPYVQIEACYLARSDCSLRAHSEVDQAGAEVLVMATSAYDLYLSRSLRHAKVVRLPAADVIPTLLRSQPGTLRVAAGIKQALMAQLSAEAGLRILDGHFLAINQAMVLPRERSSRAFQYVSDFLAEMVDAGFIARSFERHGIHGATVIESTAVRTSPGPR